MYKTGENATCVVCKTEYVCNKWKYMKNIHGYCSTECYKNSDEFIEKRNIGQKLRIEKCRQTGFYSEESKEIGCGKKCIVCDSTYTYDRKTAHNREGCCSFKCYKKTGRQLSKKIKTCLRNNGFNVDSMDDNDIKKEYHKYASDKSNLGQEKRVATINKRNGFIDLGKKGKITRYKKFLLKNNLIDKNDIDNIDYEILEKLFLENYNSIMLIGDKIKNGRILTSGSLDLSYQNGVKNNRINKINKYCEKNNIDYASLNNFQKDDINNSINADFVNSTLMTISRIEWKKKCMYGFMGVTKEKEMTDDEINELYGLYVVEVLLKKKMPENIFTGYRSTKKGWYSFVNFNKKMFYRSSWEEIVLYTLDKIKDNKNITNIFEPDPIMYYNSIKKNFRYYFPDIGFDYIDKDGYCRTLILEIKPKSKIFEEENQCKFIYAMEKYGDNFKIISEDVIFSKTFDSFLIAL